MSRIGKKPIQVPEGAQIDREGERILIRGPKGEGEIKIPKGIKVSLSDQEISVEATREDKRTKSLHGMARQKIKNKIVGVTTGWQKTLELVGTGYRASLSGDKLTLLVGFSHPVELTPPPGVSFKVEQNKITVEGSDKELVGQVAQNIRKIRPPEPYKGKGIRYEGEEIKTKPGKAAKVGLGVEGTEQ